MGFYCRLVRRLNKLTAVLITLLVARTAFCDRAALEKIVHSSGDGLAVLVLEVANGKTLFEYNADIALKPASVMKLLTTSAALGILGPDYQFSTNYLLTSSAKAPDLYLRGGGDPRFTEESLWSDARELQRRGIRKVNNIFLDDSAFSSEMAARGERAYASPASALAFNFNAIGVLTCGRQVGQPALLSALPQEAGIKLNGVVKTRLGSGSAIELQGNGFNFNLSGSIGAEQPCVALYRSVADPIAYLASVIARVFPQAGLEIAADVKVGTVASDAKLAYQHLSPPLSLIVRDLNHLSTNFVAEQLVFALGYDASSASFSHTRGLRRIEEYLRGAGIELKNAKLVDGSGLSHDNRLSARVLAEVLMHAQRIFGGGADLVSSLPIAGVSGTLEKRRFGAGTAKIRAKTGSLDGVSALAGFADSAHSGELIFIVLQNGVASREAGQALEERIAAEILNW